MRLRNVYWSVVAAALVPAAVGAQSIDPAARRAVVDTLARTIEHRYVDPDTGRRIAQVLRSHASAGVYDTITQPGRFASALTVDLQSVNHDRHLSVAYAPPGTPQRSPGAHADQSAHYGIGRIEDLAGNIGYLGLDGFSFDTAAIPKLVAALQLVEGYDALVLDLRRNRGGSAPLSNFLISHFVGPDTVPVVVYVERDGKRITRFSLASVPGPRMRDKPLFIVTSELTASAGEDFAFAMRSLGRATIVGKRTRGAGHLVAFVDLGSGFQAGVSFARVRDPRTGEEWEQRGVIPDVEADSNVAVDVAVRLAALKLAQVGAPSRAPLMRLIARTYEARAHPIVVDSATLSQYAGRYEGGRDVWLVGSTIAFRNGPASDTEILTAMSDNTFATRNGFTVSFVRDSEGRLRLRGPVDYDYKLFARIP